MAAPKKKLIRNELTPKFVAAAKKKKTSSLLPRLLDITESVRSDILLPASKDLGSLVIERKEIGDGRTADAKTLTIRTDQECESAVEQKLRAAFPEALILGEEKFGRASVADKKRLMDEVLTTDKLVFLVDALDATRDFRDGGDGYAVMITAVRNKKTVAAVVHRCTDHADPSGLGHILTFEEGDGVRLNGLSLRPLSERAFTADPEKMRGYAAIDFIMAQKKAEARFPNLTHAFDSLSDLWTCSKMYTDLVKGDHHFMLVDSPADIFDYPSGIALVERMGGVARYLDGSPATLDVIFARQNYGGGANDHKNIGNVLVLAVSEDVFSAVQRTILTRAKNAPAPKPPSP
jgi:fructose-1,6-bisphosphatase/inositol monophosphatase family enzyme